MAAVAQNAVNSGDQCPTNCPSSPTKSSEMGLDSKTEFRKNMNQLADILSKLNPWAEEFVPSSCRKKNDQPSDNKISKANSDLGIENFPNYRKNKSSFNQGKKRFNGRATRAQREESVRRTVYVSDIDQHVTEERLAALFSSCGQVVDCRICGDPHSILRFAFVEFADEHGARAALTLGGTVLGYYPLRVLPSKTAILPVNPNFLPRSEDEREMCARTIYCTNIDKKVSQADVKGFFENTCGEVSRLRILGDTLHSTRIAFVEFAMAESAIIALNCSGMILGSQPVRVSPSKTPVRQRVSRATTPS